jgi:hypothetical protein
VELVFIATRHITYLKPGRRVLAYYPNPVDLEPLLRATVALLRRDLVPAASLPPFALDIGQRLERSLDATRRKALADALGRLWSHGGVVDLSGWTRTVEATACRPRRRGTVRRVTRRRSASAPSAASLDRHLKTGHPSTGQNRPTRSRRRDRLVTVLTDVRGTAGPYAI